MTGPQPMSPLPVVLVGAGKRAMKYAKFALEHPEWMKVVGVVEPDPDRLAEAASIHDIPDERRFASVEDLCRSSLSPSAAINGTMDHLHVTTTLPLLRAGLNVLLEKPIAGSEGEIRQIVEAARQYDRLVMICHVLRYAPFYGQIHSLIHAGHIGQVRSIHTTERVSYHHFASAYVRGKWARQSETRTSSLLAKCCHDLDIICWLLGGREPASVSSFGGLEFYRPANQPDSATSECVSCPHNETCEYSAEWLYKKNHMYPRHAYEDLQPIRQPGQPPRARPHLPMIERFGRCVWDLDNDVADQQSVMVHFADGSLATHQMIGGTAKAGRTIHVVGTRGEIEGTMETGKVTLRTPDPDAENFFAETVEDVHVAGDMHGGGDLRLVEDFVRLNRGGKPSPATTTLDQSVLSHRIIFAADQSAHTGRTVDFRPAIPYQQNTYIPESHALREAPTATGRGSG